MKTAPRDELELMASRVNQMMNKLWQWHTGDFCPVDSWSPQINLYRFERRIEVCVDLAGLDPSSIDVHVEPGVLYVRGVRAAPDPRRHGEEPMRIDVMEIDHGRFCRTIRLPDQIDIPKIESQYLAGFLWVRLPMRAPG